MGGNKNEITLKAALSKCREQVAFVDQFVFVYYRRVHYRQGAQRKDGE
jgi:hypothetical protein